MKHGSSYKPANNSLSSEECPVNLGFGMVKAGLKVGPTGGN